LFFFSPQDFWKGDGELMKGILYDLPKDMWGDNSEQYDDLEATKCITGLKSKHRWDINPRLNYSYNWDRSKVTGFVSNATHYRTLNLLDTSDKVAVRELNILKQELSTMHGFNKYNLVEATLVCNDILTETFGRANKLLKYRHQDLPSLFKKQEWKEDNINKDYRDAVYQKYEALAPQNGSTDADDASAVDLPVILMVHGTSEEAAYSIVAAGFGTVSSLDAGYYGQGIYFTRSIKYACSHDASGKGEKTLILSFVTPGNTYPVHSNDVLRGNPIKPGYQSHYALVDHSGKPLKEGKLKTAVYDELVVAQDNQAIARYIIKVVSKRKDIEPKKSDTAMKKNININKPNEQVVSGNNSDDSDDVYNSDDDNFISSRKLWASHVEPDEEESNNNLNTEQKPSNEDLEQANRNLSHSIANQKKYIAELQETNNNLQARLADVLDKIARLETGKN